MKGIFEFRPREPRLCSTWSVEKLLPHFASLEPSELLNLSLKLTILLALTSALRVSMNWEHYSHWTCTVRKEDSWEFTIPIHVNITNSRPYHRATSKDLPC